MISVILNNLGLLKRLSRTVFRLSFRGIFWSLILFLPVTCTRHYINQYRGVCDVEGRFLTDEEKIRVAISQINRENYLDYHNRDYLDKHLGVPMLYASVDDFLKENPNCCAIEKRYPRPNNPSVLDIFIDSFGSFISLKYKVNYLSSKGEVSKRVLQIHDLISNCGTFIYMD